MWALFSHQTHITVYCNDLFTFCCKKMNINDYHIKILDFYTILNNWCWCGITVVCLNFMCILVTTHFPCKATSFIVMALHKIGFVTSVFFPKNKNFLEFFVFLVEIRWSLLFFWKHLPNICYHRIGKNNFMTYCHQTILFCFHYSLLTRNYLTTHLLWKSTLFITMAIHKIRFVTNGFFPPKDFFFFSPNIGKCWEQIFKVEIQLIFFLKTKNLCQILDIT